MDTSTMPQQASSAEDIQFIREQLGPIQGWLADITAASTCVLLKHQDGLSTAGGFVEIGVYGGRYLTLLARHAARAGSTVLGVDPYHHFTEQQVEATIRGALPGAAVPLVLHKGSSQDVTTEDLRRLLGGPARLVHIDGSHDGPEVQWDIEVSEPLLTPSGMMVLDDIFSARDIGVTEAFFRYQILSPRPLAPIAYVANKLFLCRQPHAAGYRAALEAFYMADTDHPQTVQFRDFLKMHRRMIETELCGRPYLVLT